MDPSTSSSSSKTTTDSQDGKKGKSTAGEDDRKCTEETNRSAKNEDTKSKAKPMKPEANANEVWTRGGSIEYGIAKGSTKFLKDN